MSPAALDDETLVIRLVLSSWRQRGTKRAPTDLLHVEHSECRVRRRRHGTAALAFGVLDSASFGRGGRL